MANDDRQNASQSSLEKALSSWGAPSLVLLSLVLLSVRLFHFIGEYAVNVLFLDQWAFWSGMFDAHGPWDLFMWQHGPHREGAGYFVIKLTALLSNWDVRTEAFVIGAIFVACAMLALAIKWRIQRQWSIFDIAIPLIVLTLASSETYVGTTNPAHGSVPLFLLLSFVFVQTLQNERLRIALSVVINFLAVFTGFTIFLGVLTIGLFGLWVVDDSPGGTPRA